MDLSKKMSGTDRVRESMNLRTQSELLLDIDQINLENLNDRENLLSNLRQLPSPKQTTRRNNYPLTPSMAQSKQLLEQTAPNIDINLDKIFMEDEKVEAEGDLPKFIED